MTAEEMARAIEAYVDGVNRHDVSAMLALRHEQATLQLMGTEARYEGKDALRGFYEELFRSAPDYRTDIEGWAFGDEVCVAWGRFKATMPQGPIEQPIVFVCTFRDGLFADDLVYSNWPARG